MATGKDIIDMLGLDYMSNKDIKPEKKIRDPFGGDIQTEESVIENAKKIADLEQTNEEATSPFQKPKEDLTKDTLEKTTVAGRLAKELSPQEEMLDTIRKYKERLNKQPERGTGDKVMDWLTGIGQGASVYNAASGIDTPTPNLWSNTTQAQEDKRKAEDLTGLQKLQSMYANYLETQKKDDLTPYQKAQLEESKKNRELKEQLAKTKKTEPSFLEKETIKANLKEKAQLNKEKRDQVQTAKKSIQGLDEQISLVKEAMKEVNRNQEESLFVDTGRFDQYLPTVTESGQKLEAALNAVSLKEMSKIFEGMSKAVDSDAERKFFQQAQASMGNNPEVNRQILNRMYERLMAIKKKEQEVIEGAKKMDAPYGPEVQRDGKVYIWNPNKNKYQLKG